VEFRPAKPDPAKGDEVSHYNLRLVTIGGKVFFDATLTQQVEGQVKIGPYDSPGLVPAHLIGRIWIQSDYLRLAFLYSGWLEENSPASFKEFKDLDRAGDFATIIASTQEVRDFLLRNSDNEKAMFSIYLCRPGVDCAMRWAEDELSRLPKYEDEDRRDTILREIGQFFFARGNYDRAVEMQRHRVELKPHDSSAHKDLGRALLFKPDFRGARIEFAAAESSEADQLKSNPWKDWDLIQNLSESATSEDAEGMVRSYFIEGDYSGTVASFGNYKGGDGFPSANPILLSYFALRRLGKRAEADALLKERSAKFRGWPDDHLLLLNLLDRVIDRDGVLRWQPNQGDVLQRFYFYRALQSIDSGDTESGRSNLQSALEVADAPKDGLPALAAKVELGRLGPSPRK
jgi:tetratricopeptide (TPR) repeat protein